jgi:hypothetical protein
MSERTGMVIKRHESELQAARKALADFLAENHLVAG